GAQVGASQGVPQVPPPLPEAADGLPQPLKAEPAGAQVTDHLQGDQVLETVAPPRPLAVAGGDRGADEVGAGPVVQGAQRDAGDPRRLGRTVTLHASPPFQGENCGPEVFRSD